MRNFNLSDLRKWKPVGIGEILDFGMPEAGFRRVSFDLIASGSVAVHAVTGGDEYWLVAYGDGHMSSKFALDEAFGLVVVGDPSTEVFLRSQVDAAVIPESEEASYTTIEPRSPGPSDDLRRMMHMVRINQERREALLRAEFEAKLAARPAVQIERKARPQVAAEVVEADDAGADE